MILSGNELSPSTSAARRPSTTRSRSSPNRSVARSPARSSIVRRFTKDCIFNVNVYNRVFSRHTPVYSTVRLLSHSFVVNVSRLTSQTLNPNSYVTCSKTFRRFKRTTMRRGVLDAFSRHKRTKTYVAFPLCLAHDQIRGVLAPTNAFSSSVSASRACPFHVGEPRAFENTVSGDASRVSLFSSERRLRFEMSRTVLAPFVLLRVLLSFFWKMARAGRRERE